jgi:hypothetical protein
MDTNPGPLLLLGGGIVIAVGTILDWGPGLSGLNIDFNGLFGIIALLIGISLAAVGGIKAFAPSTSLPDDFLGFSLDQMGFIEALTVFIGAFSVVFENGIKIGAHLTWIGAAVAIAGSVLNMRSPSGSSAPSTI